MSSIEDDAFRYLVDILRKFKGTVATAQDADTTFLGHFFGHL